MATEGYLKKRGKHAREDTMRGSYALLIRILRNTNIRIGRLGDVWFKKGLYCYIGSAMTNLEKRIKRHKSSDKRIHWHIDYLLRDPDAFIEEVLMKESDTKEECVIAGKVASRFEGVRGFGCSDCACKSHLFRVDGDPKMLWEVMGYGDES